MHYFNDGANGFLWDPLWRRNTGLTAAEGALLQHPALRRLRAVPLWGPAGRILPLNVTAWDHALGLFALVAHLRPHDWVLRAAALLSPIASNPFGPIVAAALPGEPAELAWTRLDESGIAALLAQHELDPGLVGSLVTGEERSPLAPQQATLMGLADLDRIVRATEALGIGERPAHTLLPAIKLEGDAVSVTELGVGRELIRRLAADLRTRYKARPLGLAGLAWAIATESGLTALELSRLTEAEALRQATGSTALVEVLEGRPWSVTAKQGEGTKGLHLTVSHLPLCEPLLDGEPLSAHLPEAIAILDSLTIIKGAYRIHLR
ncbi:MAG TPA: hypothetical protein VK191_04085 [Symbiobacteriaceae bacterium]|nr:hypothetical protein [Symbiobacteriaceae bacterium]